MYTIGRRVRAFYAHATLVSAFAGALLVQPSATNAQTAPEEASSPVACDAKLDGHVVDIGTHEPIVGATIRVDGTPVALSDDDGRFVLRNQCPGERNITANRADYEAKTRQVEAGKARSLELLLRPSLRETIVVQGLDNDLPTMSSVAVLDGEALASTRGSSFSDALANVPGVAQLRSANGTSKPIVRGQLGRRLLLLVDSVAHRSQEWGLDHAPEVDPFVAGELAVVRGASGVRYGPGAIGGAVIATPPRLLVKPGIATETHLMGFVARGAALASRVQVAPKSIPGLAYQLQGTAKRLAPASTPDYALHNTGSFDWNLGGTIGYREGDSEYTLSYRHYEATLGVCACLSIESSDDFYAGLARSAPIGSERYEANLAIERAKQTVSHEQAVARATWKRTPYGELSATYAFQFDNRSEFAVVRNAQGPQFDFRLTSHDADLVLEHKPLHLSNHWHLRGSVGAVATAQVHSYQGLPLIPDYQAAGGGIFAIERFIGHDMELEAGVRLDVLHRSASLLRADFLRLVRSGQLEADACGGSDSDPIDCASTFATFSASVGALYQLSAPWSVKADFATAARPPSPDEQYLNGTSPTFPIFGLGKPDIGPETTYSASFTSAYATERIAAEASVYANLIDDYIYLAPAINEEGAPIFDVLVRGSFPRFVTRPVDAIFYGADAGATLRIASGLQLGSQLSMVRAKNRTDNSFLVLVPADRLRTEATYTHESSPLADRLSATVSGTFVATQDRFDPAADLAPPPDGYMLVDAEVSMETQLGAQDVKLTLEGSNLLNTRYRDYTSLLRYFADQAGTQFMIRLSFTSAPKN